MKLFSVSSTHCSQCRLRTAWALFASFCPKDIAWEQWMRLSTKAWAPKLPVENENYSNAFGAWGDARPSGTEISKMIPRFANIQEIDVKGMWLYLPFSISCLQNTLLQATCWSHVIFPNCHAWISSSYRINACCFGLMAPGFPVRMLRMLAKSV